MSKTSREIVLDILLDIDRNDRFAGDALGGALRANQFMNKKERAYISRLTEGVTEQKIRLDYILNQFSKTKIKNVSRSSAVFYGWQHMRSFIWMQYRMKLPVMNM